MILGQLPRLALAGASEGPSTCSRTKFTLHMQLFAEHSHLQAYRASAEWPLVRRYNLSLLPRHWLSRRAFRAFADRPSRASFERSTSSSHSILRSHRIY